MSFLWITLAVAVACVAALWVIGAREARRENAEARAYIEAIEARLSPEAREDLP